MLVVDQLGAVNVELVGADHVADDDDDDELMLLMMWLLLLC